MQVAPRGSFDGKGLPVWDCSDKFVMPGLIEAHLHMSGMHTQEPYRRYFENNDVRLIRALGHAEELLAHGYTTVRELGAKGRDPRGHQQGLVPRSAYPDVHRVSLPDRRTRRLADPAL